MNSVFKKVLLLTLCAFSTFTVFSENHQQPTRKPNILFIAVDDLKPWTSAYGDKFAKTPGMDKLAREGMVFLNTYCQQAVCAASRASIMTGLHPDKTRIWDLVTDFRQVNPNVISMPQFFKSQGYETAAMGKIYHNASAGPGHDAPSWSIPYRQPKTVKYALDQSINESKGKATECANVPDNTYHDGRLTEMAIQLLDSLSENQKPFFLAVGFLKPHLPFVAPKKYWDLYDRNKLEIASFQKKAANSPDLAYHVSGELKSYTDIPQFDSYSENELNHLPVDKQKELIHGYYAAMSYTDAQILQLLNELDRLKIRDNTIIVLWGDHGWHLGDHGLWNKHTNFEQATHALLMMSVPGINKGIKPVSLSEFTDVFPTLCELANIPTPNFLDGVSLVPAMKNPEKQVRNYAFSQYPRGGNRMGYTIRTSRFRYTEWIDGGYRTYNNYKPELVIGKELYDYENDPLETENLVDKKEYASEQAKLEKLFRECIEKENSGCINYMKLANYQEPINTSGKKKSKAPANAEE